MARAHDCPWNARDAMNARPFHAAEGGHLEVLQYRQAWDEEGTCASAAQGGHLDVLQWAREHDCPWDTGTCAFAAMGGHLEVMQWARDHRAPWDQAFARSSAATGGHQEKLARWLAEHD
jgi:hypothetical protein